MGYQFRCAVRELLRRKGRTFLLVTSYALAVIATVVVVSIIYAGKQATGGILSKTGTHYIVFVPAENYAGDERMLDEKNEGFIASNGVAVSLISRDLVKKIKSEPLVEDASEYVLFKIFDKETGRSLNLGGFNINSAAVRTTTCSKGDIVSGRFLTEDDKGIVLLEEAYARTVKLTAGDEINIAGKKFGIAGVVNPGVRPAKADVYMLFDEAVDVINTRLKKPLNNEVSTILVEAASSTTHTDSIKAVQKLVPNSVTQSYACWNPASAVFGMNEGTAWILTIAIGIFCLLFAMKSQLGSVMERRKDIAILKSIGWTDGEVVTMILSESVLQAAAGGILGAAIAVLTLLFVPVTLITKVDISTKMAVAPEIGAIIFGLTLIGGIIVGVLPAIQAAKLRAADAIRRL